MMLKLMFQPSTTFMTTAMAYMLMPLIRTVMKANEIEEMAWRALSEAQLQIARDGMRLADVVEGHHHQREEEHRGDGADPVPVRGEDSVLVGIARPAHQFERPEVGRQKREARDPGGHLAPGHEEVFTGVGLLLQVEANAQHQGEVEDDDDQIDWRKMHQRGEN